MYNFCQFCSYYLQRLDTTASKDTQDFGDNKIYIIFNLTFPYQDIMGKKQLAKQT